jgi:hypothetical protein
MGEAREFGYDDYLSGGSPRTSALQHVEGLEWIGMDIEKVKVMLHKEFHG